MTGKVELIETKVDAPFARYELQITPRLEEEEGASTSLTVPAIYIDPQDGDDVDWMLILVGMVLHLQLQSEDLHRRIRAVEQDRDEGLARIADLVARVRSLEEV